MNKIDMKSTNPTLDAFLLQAASNYSLARIYRTGDIIFTEGEPGSSMILIISGQVRIFKKGVESSEQQEIALRGPGSFLGEMALVESSPRFATVVAASDCEVLEFSRDNFEKVITEQPALATKVLRSLSSKLRESDSVRIIELEESNRLLSKANDELIRLNSFLDCIIDQSPSAIILATKEGGLFRYNQAAAKMFDIDYPDTERRIDSLFVDFDFKKVRTSKSDIWHGETYGLRQSEKFPIYLSVSPLSGHNESVLHLITCQDITDLHLLNKTKLQVEKYQSEKETAAELAHDMKNYFGVLIGSIEVILSRLTDEQKEKSGKLINSINTTSKEIVSFLEDMMVTQKQKSECSCVNLKGLSQALIKFFNSQSRFQSIALSLKKEASFPEFIIINEEDIRRALINLIVNAAEAHLQHEIPNKFITIELNYTIGKEYICIKVIDNGPGIDPENLDKMFNTQFTTKDKGHGIGLMSVAKIVQNHDGRISADSTIGKGTTFTITLPIRIGDKNA